MDEALLQKGFELRESVFANVPVSQFYQVNYFFFNEAGTVGHITKQRGCYGGLTHPGSPFKGFITHAWHKYAKPSDLKRYELEFLDWVLNNSHWSQFTEDHDIERVALKGAIFDAERWSTHQIMQTAAVLRMLREKEGRVVKTWATLKKHTNPYVAFFLAHRVLLEHKDLIPFPWQSHLPLCAKSREELLGILTGDFSKMHKKFSVPMCKNVSVYGYSNLWTYAYGVEQASTVRSVARSAAPPNTTPISMPTFPVQSILKDDLGFEIENKKTCPLDQAEAFIKEFLALNKVELPNETKKAKNLPRPRSNTRPRRKDVQGRRVSARRPAKRS